MLDDLDIFMMNHLDEHNHFKSDVSLEQIENDINKLQYVITSQSKFYERYKTLGDAFLLVKTGETKDEKQVLNAQNYFDYIKKQKAQAKNSPFFQQERMESKVEPKTPSVTLKPNGNDLPIKQNFWMKIKAKLSKIFGSKPKQEEKNILKADTINEAIVDNKNNNKSFVPKVDVLKPREETIVVSDIHGNIEKWNCITKALKDKPSMKLIIEGDAMDRGKYGLQILLQIKELCDKGRAEYIPGNHDIYAYNTFATQGTQYENRPFIQVDKELWERNNGGKPTIQSYENFDAILQEEMRKGNIQHKITKAELINWLGNCPIQKKMEVNNIKFALAHAVFDDDLYKKDPKFNMKKALELQLNHKNEDMVDQFKNCMWYREFDKNTHFADINFPKGYLAVVGHTRQKEVNNQNLEGDVSQPIVYIDCGKGKLQGFNLNTMKHEQLEEPKESENNREQHG